MSKQVVRTVDLKIGERTVNVKMDMHFLGCIEMAFGETFGELILKLSGRGKRTGVAPMGLWYQVVRAALQSAGINLGDDEARDVLTPAVVGAAARDLAQPMFETAAELYGWTLKENKPKDSAKPAETKASGDGEKKEDEKSPASTG